jgi:hypothetical protein
VQSSFLYSAQDVRSVIGLHSLICGTHSHALSCLRPVCTELSVHPLSPCVQRAASLSLSHPVCSELRVRCHITPGVPVHPMLAQPTRGITEVLDRFSESKFTCEYKVGAVFSLTVCEIVKCCSSSFASAASSRLSVCLVACQSHSFLLIVVVNFSDLDPPQQYDGERAQVHMVDPKVRERCCCCCLNV